MEIQPEVQLRNRCVFLYLLLTATSPKIVDVGVNEFDNIEQNNNPPGFRFYDFIRSVQLFPHSDSLKQMSRQ